jgi:predicted dehydrogenase
MTRLTVGLVGCGHISATHLRAWSKISDVRVRGVSDSNRDLAQQRARQFGVGAYDHLERMLDECDVIDVCTPPRTHATLAGEVIGRGRHLLVEKPLVTEVEQWDRLRQLLSGSAGRLAVIHNLKFSTGIRLARRWIDEGRIGRVLRIDRQFLTDPASDRMLADDTHWSHALPGGRWFETLPHELYLLFLLAGPLELAGVTSLRSQAAPPNVRADEVVVTMAGGGAVATFHYSARCAINKRTLTVQGERGQVAVDILSDYAVLSRTRDGAWRRALGRPAVESFATLARWLPDRAAFAARLARGETLHARCIRAFADYLLDRGPSPSSIEEIDYVVRATDAIGRAIDQNVMRSDFPLISRDQRAAR